jgi:hypothetical protein
MASIARDPGSRKRIQFVAPDGKRKTTRLGKVPQRAAETIKTKVEHLLASKVSGCVWDNETARWVAEIPDGLADKLAGVGLVEPRNAATLGEMLDAFLAANPHAKPAIRVVWGLVARDLRNRFGAPRPLRTIGRAEAESCRESLIQRGLAATTITKRLRFAR